MFPLVAPYLCRPRSALHSIFIFTTNTKSVLYSYSVLVHVCEGVCGYLWIGDSRRCGWIAQFFVRPDCRGLGIGKALWERVLSRVRATGSTQSQPLLGLATFRTNPHRSFYERYGFRVLDDSPNEPSGRSAWDEMAFGGESLIKCNNGIISLPFLYL